MNKPTKEQFKDYLRIRDSGVTNMFDIKTVCMLSYTELTRDICVYIMENFEDLIEEYGE